MGGLRVFFLGVFLSISLVAQAKPALLPGQPVIDSRDCILKIVAEKMNASLKPEIVLPAIRVQNTTTLVHYQDAMEKFWKFRPDVFTNAYNPITNEIFIMTEKAYYMKHKRSVFDSLAHELVHYIQKEYQGADFNFADDSIEMTAIDVQTWFRENYKGNVKNNKFICP